jgi:hypothetical protein
MKPKSSDYNLPHNARGIDFGDFTMMFTNEGKVVFFNKNETGDHITVHPGNNSGIIDIHKTSIGPGGEKEQETLFAVENENVFPLLMEIGSIVMSEYFSLMRPLRLGWLRHRYILIINGCFPTEEIIPEITENRKRRLVFDEVALQQRIYDLEYYDDIFGLDDGAFSLVKVRRRKMKNIGTAYKLTMPNGYVKLCWIKNKDVYWLLSQLEPIIMEIVERYHLPHEELYKHLDKYKEPTAFRPT